MANENYGSHTDGIPQIEPDRSELLQEEYDTPAIPVCIKDPVRTTELPSRFAGMRTVPQVTSGAPVQLLFKDYRRKSATINALNANIILGGTQSQADLGGATWPANVPLVVTSYEEVWAKAVSTTTDISVIIESWAD